MKKKIVSILLTVCMMLCLVPTSVFAEGKTAKGVATAQELTDALADSAVDIINLNQDIEISSTLIVTRPVTLDLYGYMLEMTGSGSVITVKDGGHLTLKDSDLTATYNFTPDADGLWKWGNSGTKTVNGGVIYGGNAANGGGVYVEGGGKFTMTAGNIVGCTATGNDGLVCGGGVFVAENGVFTMTGGSIAGCTAVSKNYSSYVLGGGIRNEGTTTLSGTAEIRECHTKSDGSNFGGGISDGRLFNISGDVKVTGCTSSNNAVIVFGGEISGGTFDGTVSNRGTISGGTFEKEVTNSGTVTGGMFYGGITNKSGGKISGVTVTYQSGGSDYAKQVLQSGNTATAPFIPPSNDYIFKGWFKADGTEWDFDDPVTADMTLAAKIIPTFCGVTVTDKNGSEVRVTDKNYTDVLGDGTVIYTPPTADKSKIPAEYWDDETNLITSEAFKKIMNGEKIEGLELPKLTLNGANLQHIDIDVYRSTDPLIYTLGTFCQIELIGNNTVTYSGEYGAAIGAECLLIDGDGSLAVNANGAHARGISVSNSGGLYYQRGGTVTVNSVHNGISCEDAIFKFTGGKLTIQSENGSWGLDRLDIADSTTFMCGNSEETSFEIESPFSAENIIEQLEAAAIEGKVNLSKIYYLQLTANYTVTFDTDGGSNAAQQTVHYGDKAVKPADLTKSGYTFDGWYTEAEHNSEYKFDVPVKKNITLYAKWNVNQYTITFDSNGGTAVDSITADYGTAITAPSDPTRTGYIFAGWDKQIPSTMPAEDMTITAKWDVKQYTIIFNSNGGTAVDPIAADYGTAITAPSNPTRTGYIFAGWDKQIPSTMPDRNVMITAQWTLCDHSGNTNKTTCEHETVCSVCGGTIAADPHAFSQQWSYNASEHWHECHVCGIQIDNAEHTFEWVTDKEATETEKGEKHEECSVCHATRNEHTEIPATGKDNVFTRIYNWILKMIIKLIKLIIDFIYSIR